MIPRSDEAVSTGVARAQGWKGVAPMVPGSPIHVTGRMAGTPLGRPEAPQGGAA